MAASNTEECLLELRGRTIVGVLVNAFPVHRKSPDESTRTLLLDDGTGITWNHRGSFWRENAEDVKRALDLRIKELSKAQDAMQRILENAGAIGNGRSGEWTVEQTKPHRLTAAVDRWGEVAFQVECPYVLGEKRPCNLFEETKDCKDEDCPHPWLEFGHGHPVEGCVVQHYIAELGWAEAVRWTAKDKLELALPADVAVWCDEDGVEMEPWVGRDEP